MDDHFENPRYGAKDLISHPPSDYLKTGRVFFGCEGNEPPLGKIRLADWLEENKHKVGAHYASEIEKHYKFNVIARRAQPDEAISS